MNQIAKAAELALSTCPKTAWSAHPIYDRSDQRLAFETMKSQLLDDASRARARVYTMLVHWALTGTWPKFRNAPVFFLRQILIWSAAKTHFGPETDFPDTPPPWDPKHVAHFLNRTALGWYSLQSDAWARDAASDAFGAQESTFQMMIHSNEPRNV
jgi:hypothetical protein